MCDLGGIDRTPHHRARRHTGHGEIAGLKDNGGGIGWGKRQDDTVAGGGEAGMDVLQRKLERKNLEMMHYRLVGAR